MKQKVLKTNELAIENDLKQIKLTAQKFQPLLGVMIWHEYEPTEAEFKEIVLSRANKRSEKLDDFLRAKTVKKHPSIDSLPITDFMKKTMIKLPAAECSNIESAFSDLPTDIRFLNEVCKMDIKNGKVLVSQQAKQSIIDGHTVYANDTERLAYELASNLLKMVNELQNDYGINFFNSNLIQRVNVGNLKDATINPEVVKFAVSQHKKTN